MSDLGTKKAHKKFKEGQKVGVQFCSGLARMPAVAAAQSFYQEGGGWHGACMDASCQEHDLTPPFPSLCCVLCEPQVSGRVLTVDPAARKLTLTLKPSLLGSKLPLITCLQVGMQSSGARPAVGLRKCLAMQLGAVAELLPACACGLGAQNHRRPSCCTMRNPCRQTVFPLCRMRCRAGAPTAW